MTIRIVVAVEVTVAAEAMGLRTLAAAAAEDIAEMEVAVKVPVAAVVDLAEMAEIAMEGLAEAVDFLPMGEKGLIMMVDQESNLVAAVPGEMEVLVMAATAALEAVSSSTRK